MIVITLSKVPKALRGDLTKWCQEIQTGVYVGRFSARIREQLWMRIEKNIGNGEATMVYSTNNELGYNFRTTVSTKKVVDFDGIPLLMQVTPKNEAVKHGFSNAAKIHRAKKAQEKLIVKKSVTRAVYPDIVAIDIETTGLDCTQNSIISISAVRKVSEEYKTFNRYIKISTSIPENIVKLTGITDTLLVNEGVELIDGLKDLISFLRKSIVVGYNVRFDFDFLHAAYKQVGLDSPANRVVDLAMLVKKDNEFLDNYRFATVLKEYEVDNTHPHNSLSDSIATYELAIKLIENDCLRI
ncbi:type I-E CRISPR-associated endoribonuclease Cas2 [Ligilactobacillus agilis]|uniref:DNA polymerase III polC-type n=1 Tax=Ligilactobacillus agilis TaxID=1601 RepID=A0A2I2A8D2_9LACO|nr:type I-E CRISPR-associated endoribonuclease Cas2e [Ligilactobacillus agilis]PLA75649.1 type I-E CRISPR-associated endoribonuclease Cas2 [Ligilactobacillus agilis]PLA83809.1 type I-E CRISPR-associated endoribonuclease Cas2 [Ligilactobacillus agilis]